MLHKIKSLIKNIYAFDNAFGFYCPDCAEVYKTPTAFVHMMWDEKHKCFKKYIQCDECLRTTPAYKNRYEMIDQWREQWEIIQGSDCMLNNI